MTATSSEAFEGLLDKLFYGGLDARDKGDKFERLMQAYLLTDPVWASQFSDVWLWKDYPKRNGRPDTGIDLVARASDTGELTAVQCKFIDPETTVSKAHLDSFIAASSRREFSRRLLVSTSVKWGKNAEDSVRELNPPLTRLNFHDLASSSIDWSQFSLDTPDQIVRIDGEKTLRPHQRKALEAVTEGFTRHDRGKMIMACGTGKTFTSLQIMENLTPKNGKVLFLVPSIALLSQTLREWKHDASEDFRALAVCSDVGVGKNTDEDISTTDLIVPATTNPQKLLESRELAREYKGRTVVFSTYQSIDVISQAQAEGFDEFDLIISDEAHRTTGATLAGTDESAFVRVHDNDFVRGKKRLYMTATPKVFDERTKAKADENSVVIASMDDTTKFGPEFYYLGFGEAVEKNLLADYKVLVLAVDENAVNEHLQNLLTDEEGELSIDDVARLVGCWNGLATRGTDDPERNKNLPRKPMQRAVAFAANIKESKRVASIFPNVTHELAEGSAHDLVAEADHVDGSMNVALRNQKLDWLKQEPEPGTCRILSNARCLSEGVDVPSLDAVLFLNPRNSQVDVVQSVGRVMRKAPGKDYGYIILPVGIPTGMKPEQALKDSKRYKVIWSVLNALRSHDDRFEAMVNKIDLNENRDAKLQIIGVGSGTNDDGFIKLDKGVQGAFDFDFEGLDQWRDAIYAKIVQKVGDREYWENWSKTIADVAGRHTDRIRKLVTQNSDPKIATAFQTFTEALRSNLNEGITAEDAVSMLSQHLITKPVFDALFENYDFASNNPVSRVMQRMIRTIEGNNLPSETEELNDFYASVAKRASGIENSEGKQRIITELYENFFKQAFPKQASALGVVYTPIEIVDFIIRSVDQLSKEYFGKGLTNEGVHVLDPFTGTGTFIVRLLQSGVISPHDLARKYAAELHANEIMLLAYYIAAINIEATYHGTEGGDYKPFDGMVLADTFQMSEDGDTLDNDVFTVNNVRAQRQLDTDITVIIGNPPYSAGQSSSYDNNANRPYPTLDKRIRETYALDSQATLKNSLYDSYIRAIRWGSDRVGERGILAYVTNGGYIDSNTADGLRKHLAKDFNKLIVYNLRGNALGSGEIRKREAGNVFGGGTRTTVAIIFGIKEPTLSSESTLLYRDIGDYLTRDEKLSIIKESSLADDDWKVIIPNQKHEWINQSSASFDAYHPIGDKDKKTGMTPIFKTYSSGVKTSRDAWAYNSSRQKLANKIETSIDFYNSEVHRFMMSSERPSTSQEARDWVKYDSTQFKWDRINFTDLLKQRCIEFDGTKLRESSYRPFFKQRLYFDPSQRVNNTTYQMPSMFPTPFHENYGFYVTAPSSSGSFALLATDQIPCLDYLGRAGQYFARYTYAPISEEEQAGLFSGGQENVAGYLKIDNITDEALGRYQKAFGSDVSKDHIFQSIYAILHSEQYRKAFAADLKRQLPRIPMPDDVTDFFDFAEAGSELLRLHIGYESVEPYGLTKQHSHSDDSESSYLRVDKMHWGGKTRQADKTTIAYNTNVTLMGIPDEAHDYMVGSRSALDWLLDRYQIKTDKPSSITNDPNDWAIEIDDPAYILDLIERIVTVSLETRRVVNTLPEISDL